ncbi:MAG: CBS domain-containing protein [Desulfobacterales bacterium]|jgi:nanoRNase/pAp phosphatase (c-di-AMP/oligoRNAs hydrolase)|nr:CBS domain-containing protein [Desulfobacterales bacterium]
MTSLDPFNHLSFGGSADPDRPVQIATPHRNTDFDALACTIAATLLYPGALAVLPRSLNPNVRAFLSIHKDHFDTCNAKDIDLQQVGRLIVVDVNRWERLEGLSALKKRQDLEIIVWDHHNNPSNIDTTECYQSETGAAITLMVQELKVRKTMISPIQATLFLTGLYEDTGHLTFPSTRPEDAYAAAWLLERGADLNVLGTFLRPAYGQRQKEILFEMVRAATRTRVAGHTVSIAHQQVDGHVDGLAVVVRMYRELVNVDAAFGIFTSGNGDRCMVIGRSNVEGLNIGTLMHALGGGGHPGAGSAMLRQVNPQAVEEMILELIRGNQQASVQVSDLMSFPVETVPADMTMGEVAKVLHRKGCTGLPVVEAEKLVGVISRRDFRKLKRESQFDAPVKAFMSRDPVTIGPGISPVAAARLMVKHDVGRLPVVEDDRLIGIVTRSDVMTYFYDLMPD